MVKNLPSKAGDTRALGLILGSGRSPGEVNVTPLQYSCLENSMERRAWQVIVHGSQGVQHDSARKQECTSILQLTACSNIHLPHRCGIWEERKFVKRC